MLVTAKERGIAFYSGVPCSYLTPLLNAVIRAPNARYVGAASEGEALAVVAGATVAGAPGCLLCQNSGLGNVVNPLTSLLHPFRIPVLIVTTWRGRPGEADEPQHELMGQITPDLLRLTGVQFEHLTSYAGALEEAFDRAVAHMESEDLPFAFIMAKGTVAPETLEATPPRPYVRGDLIDRRSGEVTTRWKLLEQFLAEAPQDAAIIATTGWCGRELMTLSDRPQHFYMIGALGCASPFGLGVALNSTRPVIVLDGDGAALMKLGAWGTIAAAAPTNLVHVLFDNGVHDSTGGQPTVSSSLDFGGMALAAGYARVALCDAAPGFLEALRWGLEGRGPTLIHVRTAPGTLSSLQRPTLSPPELTQRFSSFLTAP